MILFLDSLSIMLHSANVHLATISIPWMYAHNVHNLDAWLVILSLIVQIAVLSFTSAAESVSKCVEMVCCTLCHAMMVI